MTKRLQREVQSATQLRSEGGRVRPWWVWWLLATALVAAADLWRLAGTAPVVHAPMTAQLTPDWGWSPPLSRWDCARVLHALPGWVFCLLAGGLVGHACSRVASQSIWLAAALGAGLALSIEARDLWPAAGIVWLTRWSESLRSREHSLRTWGRWLVPVTVSFVGSLEFGLVACLALAIALSQPAATSVAKRRLGAGAWVPTGLVALFIGVCQLSPGVRAAFWRPLSWIWLRPGGDLLASLSPVLTVPEELLPQLLLIGFVAAMWWNHLGSATQSGGLTAVLMAGSVIGLGCSRYLCLCSLALALTMCPAMAVFVARWQRRTILAAGTGAVVALLSSHAEVLTRWVLEGSLPARTVDVSRWGITGPVLLFNLDRSPEWRSETNDKQLPLLLDDRWDLFGTEYPKYAQVCRDLCEVRHESYRLETGAWGGYRMTLRDWNPALVVVGAADLDAIRSMSLSPDLRILALDGERTIFGHAEHPAVSRRSAATIQVLTQLEWPVQPILDPQVIVASNNRDQLRVSATLNALRLPYASLRLLPQLDAVDVQRQRTWSYLELAHRCRRYSGAASLLDQFRGVKLARRGQALNWWTDADRQRLSRCFAALRLPGLARELSGTMALPNPAEVRPQDADNNVSQLRLALLAGDDEDSERLFEAVSAQQSAPFRSISQSVGKTVESVYHELDSAVAETDLTDALRAELEFYLGCLAIEAGDARSARHWLSQSQTHDPSSPFSSLREFYLSQLGGP